MEGSEVARIAAWLAARGVVYQCNGGWAVDALVGRQTRPHGDLDVFLDASAVADAVAWLEQDGYRVAEDWLPVRVELTGTWTRGRTVVDRRDWSGDMAHDPHGLAPATVDVALEANGPWLADLWLHTVSGAWP